MRVEYGLAARKALELLPPSERQAIVAVCQRIAAAARPGASTVAAAGEIIAAGRVSEDGSVLIVDDIRRTRVP